MPSTIREWFESLSDRQTMADKGDLKKTVNAGFSGTLFLQNTLLLGKRRLRCTLRGALMPAEGRVDAKVRRLTTRVNARLLGSAFCFRFFAGECPVEAHFEGALMPVLRDEVCFSLLATHGNPANQKRYDNHRAASCLKLVRRPCAAHFAVHAAMCRNPFTDIAVASFKGTTRMFASQNVVDNSTVASSGN